ncbi:spore coat U domain-containing protein [Gilvimarinus agarilyticus]|uniref:Csu type fimbrial protein n=1 Tax=unclassified Gilvimarinus TaxID=2642066 RepID=UPI001C08C9D4|nr:MULTISPECIES: spore coat U domain-containing protein [unclassified Gilvimarinus]MBU2886483.1 spore coat U domain-containing protein [Gilvimarinus agarilyticus]MDO6571162.1 spore coat U domain-containing protein [Gilvimarinus sp. 2_MG-2023]MDO6748537.1 spore coat U domain-containing protein [Gilvimarinus sp. 1_MG-2023]
MKNSHLHFFVSLAILTFSPLALSDTETGNFDVTITITASCTIDTASDGNINFGTQASTATNIQISTASIDVSCTQGTPYTIALNDGTNSDGTSRRMKGQTVATDYIPYELYSDAYTTPWGDGVTLGSVKSGLTGNGGTQNHVIYAQVPSANASAQDYQDSVTATITW